MPHLGIDPVPIACQLVQGFQTILTRNLKPVETGVISVTMIQAGEATNVAKRGRPWTTKPSGLPSGSVISSGTSRTSPRATV